MLVHSLTLAAGLARSLTVAGTATLLTLVLAAALVLAFRAGRSDESQPKDDATRSAAGSGLDQPHFTVAGIIAAVAALIVLTTWAWPHLVGATRLWV